jgi:hypothetical protein
MSVDNAFNMDFSGFDLTQLLPSYLQDNPFYNAYLEATSTLWKNDILPYIKALAELRQTITYSDKEKQDLWALIKNANLLGYRFLSKYMTQDNYVKLVEFLAKFHETQGTSNLPDFIGFIRGASLHLEQLWTAYGTDDYTVFVEKALTLDNTILTHPGVTTPGTYYPTNHYRLTYYLDQTGLLDNDILQELFYNLAPIHYVLESVVALILFTNEPYYLDVVPACVITEAVLVDREMQALTYQGNPLTYQNNPLQSLVVV